MVAFYWFCVFDMRVGLRKAPAYKMGVRINLVDLNFGLFAC